MAVLKSFIMGPGEQFVMMPGVSVMPTWFVASWDSLVHHLLLVAQSTAKGLVRSGWMMSVVMEESLHCFNVDTQVMESKTAVTVKMQVWFVSKPRRKNFLPQVKNPLY